MVQRITNLVSVTFRNVMNENYRIFYLSQEQALRWTNNAL